MDTQPDRDTIRQRVIAIPLTEDGLPVDEPTALAILEDLTQNGSHIPEHIKAQIGAISLELMAKLAGEQIDDDHFSITEIQLRGIIARAAIAGAAQAISDSGQTILNISEVTKLLFSDQPDIHTRNGTEDR